MIYDVWMCPIHNENVLITAYLNSYPNHHGIDFGVAEGTTLYSVLNGVVLEAGWLDDLGYYVIVNGSNGFSFLYGHLSSLSVNSGDTVTTSSIVGSSGNTGTATSGPHLHWELQSANWTWTHSNLVDARIWMGCPDATIYDYVRYNPTSPTTVDDTDIRYYHRCFRWFEWSD